MVAELLWQTSWCFCTRWANTSGLGRTGKCLSEATGICENSQWADLCMCHGSVGTEPTGSLGKKETWHSFCHVPFQAHRVYTTGKFLVELFLAAQGHSKPFLAALLLAFMATMAEKGRWQILTSADEYPEEEYLDMSKSSSLKGRTRYSKEGSNS